MLFLCLSGWERLIPFSLLEAMKGLVAINEPGLIGYRAKRVFFLFNESCQSGERSGFGAALAAQAGEGKAVPEEVGQGAGLK